MREYQNLMPQYENHTGDNGDSGDETLIQMLLIRNGFGYNRN